MFTYFLGGVQQISTIVYKGEGGSIMFEISSTQNKDSPQSEFTNHVATMRAFTTKCVYETGAKISEKSGYVDCEVPLGKQADICQNNIQVPCRTRVGAICYYLIRLIFCGNNSQLGIHYLVSSYAISKYKDKNLEFIYFFCKMSMCLELVAWTQEC